MRVLWPDEYRFIPFFLRPELLIGRFPQQVHLIQLLTRSLATCIVFKVVSGKFIRVWCHSILFEIWLDISFRSNKFHKGKIPLLERLLGEFRQENLQLVPMFAYLPHLGDEGLIVFGQELLVFFDLASENIHVAFSDAFACPVGQQMAANYGPVFAVFLDSKQN